MFVFAKEWRQLTPQIEFSMRPREDSIEVSLLRLDENFDAKGIRYARRRNNRAGARRRTPGQVAVYASRRIRARRNGAHSKRRTRGTLRQTSNRHWPVKGASRRREIAGAKTRENFVAHAASS